MLIEHVLDLGLVTELFLGMLQSLEDVALVVEPASSGCELGKLFRGKGSSFARGSGGIAIRHGRRRRRLPIGRLLGSSSFSLQLGAWDVLCSGHDERRIWDWGLWQGKGDLSLNVRYDGLVQWCHVPIL